MILVLAEKPSVAKDIANVIGASTKKGNSYVGSGYVVTWAYGHLVTLCDASAYDERYEKWVLADLPILPKPPKYQVIEDYLDHMKFITDQMNHKDIEYIVNATDAGREGEYIFGLIYRYANCKAPVKRFWQSSMVPETIEKGFKSLIPGSEKNNLFLSAESRAYADWIVGINFSRLFSLKTQQRISVGRVQTPTLALIVNRDLAIDLFKPTDFYQVNADFGTHSGIWFNEDTNRFTSKMDAMNLISSLKGATGKIESVSIEPKREKCPNLFDLTALQRAANTLYGYSAKRTLEIAQSLYEKHKLITYPRTDSRFLTSDFESEIPGLLNKLSMGSYKAVIDGVFETGLNISSNIINDSKVTDHHAIIPTGYMNSVKDLNKDELNIFLLVANRFVAIFMPDAITEVTTLVTRVNGERFKTKGTRTLQLGWQALEKPSKTSEDESDDSSSATNLNKSFEKGELAIVRDTKLLSKKTTAPKRMDENILLEMMENVGRFIDDESLKSVLHMKGIGTVATRADIIEKLLQQQYIERKGRQLYSTSKGRELIKIVPESIKSPELTAEWESQLTLISEGTLLQETFNGAICDYVTTVVNATIEDDSISASNFSSSVNTPFCVCPNCGKNIFENAKSYSCEGYKDQSCFVSLFKDNAFFTARGKKLTKTIAIQLFTKQRALVKGFKKKNSDLTYDAFVILTIENNKSSLSIEFPSK